MGTVLAVVGLVIFAFLINLPLGLLRRGCEKFTFGWYFYVHISIPVIIYARVKMGLGWKFIPLTLVGAVAGQLIGGRLQGKGGKS